MQRSKPYLAGIWVLALVVAALSACGGGDGGAPEPGGSPTQTRRPQPERFDLVAQDFSFIPDVIELEVGDSLDIRLTNQDSAAHTFTVDELFVDFEVAPGEEVLVPLTASEPGQFNFYCRFHVATGMLGILRVGLPPRD